MKNNTISPMQTAGIQNFIERIYRESGLFQWIRELFTNSAEAGATRIEFGIEWQAVESQAVYRRLIADNGCGMDEDDLVAFFNTFGGGGKPIGGVHENFGVGSKTSLLPWNKYGVVVVSWKDGEPTMIWVKQDPSTGNYGLRLIECEDPETGAVTMEEAYPPFIDEEHGLDWELVKPDWIDQNGTVIVLMGNGPVDDTVKGDPGREEADIKGISSYLNRRIWDLPEDLHVTVDELRSQDQSQWPENEEMAHRSGGSDRRTNLREVRGSRHFVTYPSAKSGSLESSGTLSLDDGTEIEWFIWEGERPHIHSYAAKGGFIAALYKNELYDVTSHHSTYRSFGVTESTVRQRLTLVIKPQGFDEESGLGVYPRTDRNALLVRGGPQAGTPLPLADWGAEFVDKMPDEVLAAIKAARSGGAGSIKDSTWRKRLADRFGARWKILKRRARKNGSSSVTPSQQGAESKPKPVVKKRKKRSGGGSGGTGGALNTGSKPGAQPAVKSQVAGGMPDYRLVNAGEGVSDNMLAAWAPNDPAHQPHGAVLVNVDHPVLAEAVDHWQAKFADHLTEEVRDEVLSIYGEMAVAKIAHSEHLKSILPAYEVEKELRSESALTMALLGLIGEEALIAPRLAGKLGRKKAAA